MARRSQTPQSERFSGSRKIRTVKGLVTDDLNQDFEGETCLLGKITHIQFPKKCEVRFMHQKSDVQKEFVAYKTLIKRSMERRRNLFRMTTERNTLINCSTTSYRITECNDD